MENCCHIWVGAPSCYLELLDKLEKWICRTVGPSLTASFEPLVLRRNVASSSLFYRYYFGRCSSELAQLVFLFFLGGLLVILIDCMIFLSPLLYFARMFMSTVSFLVQLVNRFPVCLIFLCFFFVFLFSYAWSKSQFKKAHVAGLGKLDTWLLKTHRNFLQLLS